MVVKCLHLARPVNTIIIQSFFAFMHFYKLKSVIVMQ
jgi:hypothetical protein